MQLQNLTEAEQEEEDINESFSAEESATIDAFLHEEDDTNDDDNVTASVCLAKIFSLNNKPLGTRR